MEFTVCGSLNAYDAYMHHYNIVTIVKTFFNAFPFGTQDCSEVNLIQTHLIRKVGILNLIGY